MLTRPSHLSDAALTQALGASVKQNEAPQWSQGSLQPQKRKAAPVVGGGSGLRGGSSASQCRIPNPKTSALRVGSRSRRRTSSDILNARGGTLRHESALLASSDPRLGRTLTIVSPSRRTCADPPSRCRGPLTVGELEPTRRALRASLGPPRLADACADPGAPRCRGCGAS